MLARFLLSARISATMRVCRISFTKKRWRALSIYFPPSHAACWNYAPVYWKKNWADEETVIRVIARLQELGYLNDAQFAAQYATSRLVTKPIGKVRLRRDLQRKKISSTVIHQALEDVYTEQSEDALLEKALAKRVRLRGVPTTPEATKKLFDHLLRLGFSYDLVIKKVRAIGKTDSEADDL